MSDSPARPEDALEAAENALRNWQTCYPESVFVPPSKEAVKAASDLLRANGFTPDALYAEWGRHIAGCVGAAVAPALAALAVLLAERDAARRENTVMRGLLAHQRPCHYCGAETMSKCPRGFPGCALADDLLIADDVMLTEETTLRLKHRAEQAEAERDEREQALRRAELQLWELDKVARSECDDPFAVVKTLAFAVRMGITKALAGGVRSADAGSGGETA